MKELNLKYCNFFYFVICPKLLKGTLSGMRQFWAYENPFKMMKNAFYFTSKVFYYSRYLSFCLDFLVMQQNGLIRKIRLISNFMTSQPG